MYAIMMNPVKAYQILYDNPNKLHNPFRPENFCSKRRQVVPNEIKSLRHKL